MRPGARVESRIHFVYWKDKVLTSNTKRRDKSMRSSSIVTISLPPAMAKQMEKVQQKEHRTRSELLREAWRHYFESRYPEYTPTKAEAAAIRLGRAEIKRGEFVTLEQLDHELATANRSPRTKSSRKASAEDRRLIRSAFEAMRRDPFGGDI
jgi:predicted transcriptional regulator